MSKLGGLFFHIYVSATKLLIKKSYFSNKQCKPLFNSFIDLSDTS